MQRRTFLKGASAAVGGIGLSTTGVLAGDTQLEPGNWYDASVIDNVDGDTVDVELDSDGTQYDVRVLGIDTPEKSGYTRYEKTEEWEGIEDDTYLEDWGNKASEFAKDELPVGTECQIAVDDESKEEDQYGRLLAKIRYDRSGDGSMDTIYNKVALREGYARVYSATMSNTDEYWDLEDQARADGVRVWTESDPSNTPEVRDNDVAQTFHPNTSSVKTSGGAIADSRVPMWAESEATQSLDSGAVDYASGSIPLVGVDEGTRVALFGGQPIQEDHDDYSDHLEHFVFAANLIDHLAADTREGMVLLEGGHHQFEGSYACAAEDIAFFQRYLEGQGIEVAGVNEVDTSTGADLSNARGIVVTSPKEAFDTSEVDALSTFVGNGGAVVLMGSAKSSSTRRSNLDDLAADLGSDLRLNEDAVTDDTNNVNDDADLLTTTQFNESDFSLWSAYSGSTQDYVLSIPQVQRNAGTLNDEYVDVRNDDSESVDLTDFTLENDNGQTYTFPTDFTLGAGDTVRVHTGTGSDSSTDLYWGAAMFRWDNDNDRATVRDPDGDEATEHAWAVEDVIVPLVHPDGSDLNDEYVDFKNVSGSSVDMTDWTVRDEADHTYTFPTDFSLADGDTVRLHTGDGDDTSTDLYWGSGSYIWNDSGDTVYLADDGGNLVQTREYPSPYDLSITEISLDGETLNDEYVDVTNDGSTIVDMSGFTLEDEAGNTYVFPDSFGLGAGDTVRVHTGDGTDSTTDLYWGRDSGVWNDDGDTAYVFDDNEVQVAKKSSSSSSCDATICVAKIHEDGDTLNDEWVDFENTSGSDMDMTDWTVEDEAGHTYTFPDNYTLTADGGTGRLHTGDGTDSSSDGDIYWGSGSYIWNDSGDTVYLYEPDGTLHTSKSY